MSTRRRCRTWGCSTRPDEYLLRQEGVDRLVTGQVTEQCILYSAPDANVRRYRLMRFGTFYGWQ